MLNRTQRNTSKKENGSASDFIVASVSSLKNGLLNISDTQKDFLSTLFRGIILFSLLFWVIEKL
jgi:hypothetical protein